MNAPGCGFNTAPLTPLEWWVIGLLIAAVVVFLGYLISEAP